jgi:adenylate cyclase
MINISENFPGYKTIKPMIDTVKRCESILKNEPENIDAQIGLADSYFTLGCYGIIPYSEAIEKVEASTLIILRLNDKLSDAHTLSALIKLSKWNWEGAEQEFNLAISLDPKSAKAHHWYALYLASMGHFKESITESKKAVGLDPTARYKIGLGSMYYFAQNFEELKNSMKEVISEESEFAQGYDWLGMAYIQLKDYDNSIEVYEKAAHLSGRLAEILGGLGHAYGMAGKEKEAKLILNELNTYSLNYHIPPVQVAFVYASLKQFDKVFEMLERAYEERSWELIFIRVEPWFEYLHSENHFKEFISRINFPSK